MGPLRESPGDVAFGRWPSGVSCGVHPRASPGWIPIQNIPWGGYPGCGPLESPRRGGTWRGPTDGVPWKNSSERGH